MKRFKQINSYHYYYKIQQMRPPLNQYMERPIKDIYGFQKSVRQNIILMLIIIMQLVRQCFSMNDKKLIQIRQISFQVIPDNSRSANLIRKSTQTEPNSDQTEQLPDLGVLQSIVVRRFPEHKRQTEHKQRYLLHQNLIHSTTHRAAAGCLILYY